MRGLRAPVVGGVAGGVGTTTVATALHGTDSGVGLRSDVIVCRGTGDSLRRAAALAEHLGPGPRPVLAVHVDGGGAGRGPLHARLRMIEAHFSAVVLLPRVARWATLAEPLDEAAGLLAVPARELPRALRPYAVALHELARATAMSGRLHRPLTPAPAGPARTENLDPNPGGAPQPAGSIGLWPGGTSPAYPSAAHDAGRALADRPLTGGLAHGTGPDAPMPDRPPTVPSTTTAGPVVPLPGGPSVPRSHAARSIETGPMSRAPITPEPLARPAATSRASASRAGSRPRRSVRILPPPAPADPAIDGPLRAVRG